MLISPSLIASCNSLTESFILSGISFISLVKIHDAAVFKSLASEALTDGSDDKKCDLIYIDRDSGFAVVAHTITMNYLHINRPNQFVLYNYLYNYTLSTPYLMQNYTFYPSFTISLHIPH